MRELHRFSSQYAFMECKRRQIYVIIKPTRAEIYKDFVLMKFRERGGTPVLAL